ncbi:MAG: response regulator [Ignavibacteriales bacterium]|nr:response regulator [Ignavibacteriales bacterium]
MAGLKQAGFDVIEADNGDDAILLARKFRPRLAILDMRMQGKSGMDAGPVPGRQHGYRVHVPVRPSATATSSTKATRMGALGSSRRSPSTCGRSCRPCAPRWREPASRTGGGACAGPGLAATPRRRRRSGTGTSRSAS